MFHSHAQTKEIRWYAVISRISLVLKITDPASKFGSDLGLGLGLVTHGLGITLWPWYR